jgi:hypothetical protein
MEKHGEKLPAVQLFMSLYAHLFRAFMPDSLTPDL